MKVKGYGGLAVPVPNSSPQSLLSGGGGCASPASHYCCVVGSLLFLGELDLSFLPRKVMLAMTCVSFAPFSPDGTITFYLDF